MMTANEVLAHLETGGAVEETQGRSGAYFAIGSADHVVVNCCEGCCMCDYDSFDEFWKWACDLQWQIADWW